jgi:hypothetical protein
LFIPFDETGSGYNLIVTVYIVVWIILFAIDQLLVFFHKRAQTKGYLLLFKKTRRLIHAPFIIWCTGTQLNNSFLTKKSQIVNCQYEQAWHFWLCYLYFFLLVISLPMDYAQQTFCKFILGLKL